ncbi:Ribosomal protein S18 acetylase RimI [Roseateles sp. YR242]|uniref:GNAT family N-acetyltransferase n=1 Tax=Roseateles sp. YR242 TaxID=1855305 RepID=UPI0008D3ECF6|nr:GNAT family N-acetyltransferase [Roseateles sp. YR242]SEL91997.1 Ribosomal protein S18 acetylase RimI [Roseateles sp. YR242]
MSKAEAHTVAPPFHPTVAILLRPAEPDDALCLGVLATQVWLDTYAKPGIRTSFAQYVRSAFASEAMLALIKQPDVRLVVAECEGHLVGLAQYTLRRPPPLAQPCEAAELDRLYVQEPFTGKGVGARLNARVEAECVSLGTTTLWLQAWTGNARALAFYARHGYADVGTTFFEMDGERHENRVLAKSLSSTR